MDRPGFSRMDMIIGETNDTDLNHVWYRDDKKRKAFKRGGPQKPKEPPQYEKDLIAKFHSETQVRFTKAKEEGLGFTLPKIQKSSTLFYDGGLNALGSLNVTNKNMSEEEIHCHN